MDTSILACPDGRIWSEKRVYAGTFSLSGFNCIHASTPEYNSAENLKRHRGHDDIIYVGNLEDSEVQRRSLKYASITNCNTHIFAPVAIETLGPICSCRLSFVADISNRLTGTSGDSIESFILLQMVSMLIQRFSQVVFRGTFICENNTED